MVDPGRPRDHVKTEFESGVLTVAVVASRDEWLLKRGLTSAVEPSHAVLAAGLAECALSGEFPDLDTGVSPNVAEFFLVEMESDDDRSTGAEFGSIYAHWDRGSVFINGVELSL